VKTPGETAFNVYRYGNSGRRLSDGKPMESWKDVGRETQRDWEELAVAVLASHAREFVEPEQ